MNMLANVGKYRKFIVAAAGLAAMVFGVPVVAVEAATTELLDAVVAVITAAGVYLLPNKL